MGGPKALVELGGEPLVRHALRALAEGGCSPLVVVLGAAAERVREAVPPGVLVVEEPGWAEGMGASLRAGIGALERLAPRPDAVVLHLVDLPGVTAGAVSRLAARSTPDVLARAAYSGQPAHPVLIGRSHWTAVRDGAVGDAGARGYLAASPALELVECGDVAEPADVDTPEQLADVRGRWTDPR
jgi:nicotine blue oxidoreductase